MQILGICPSCGKPVFRRYSHTMFGKVPQFRIVEGKGVYHNSCWKDDRKAYVSKKITTYKSPSTPLGRISKSKEHY